MGGDTFVAFGSAGSGRALKFDATGDKAFCIEEMLPPYYADGGFTPGSTKGKVGWSLRSNGASNNRLKLHPDKEYMIYSIRGPTDNARDPRTMPNILQQESSNPGLVQIANAPPYEFTEVLNPHDPVGDPDLPVLDRKWLAMDAPWDETASYGAWSSIPGSQFWFGKKGTHCQDSPSEGYFRGCEKRQNPDGNQQWGHTSERTAPKFAFVTQGKGTDNPRHWALYPFEHAKYRTVVLKVTWGD